MIPAIQVRQIVAAAIVAVCGVVWRLAPLGLPPFWVKYGGSILWGAMVLLIVGVFDPRPRPSWTTSAVAAVIALAAELFRLYHAPALDAFRLTLMGGLLLGHVFSLWNVVAYWAGIVVALPLRAALISIAR